MTELTLTFFESKELVDHYTLQYTAKQKFPLQPMLNLENWVSTYAIFYIDEKKKKIMGIKKKFNTLIQKIGLLTQ